MVSKRNRILELTNYLESLGIQVNVGKNKAFGNKGVFKAVKDVYRIDIAKGQCDEAIISTLAHEFAHFVHYQYDKSLKNLDFIFPSNDGILEELIAITVQILPKSTIKPLFDKKEALKQEILIFEKKLNELYPDFKKNIKYKKIEQKIKNTNLKYLLKYDKVKLIEFYDTKVYSIEDLQGVENDVELYLQLKSKMRALKRVHSKISRMNKYYNLPTELFARSFELYVSNSSLLEKIAPKIFLIYNQLLIEDKEPLITTFLEKI
jgi:hypothetical protein